MPAKCPKEHHLISPLQGISHYERLVCQFDALPSGRNQICTLPPPTTPPAALRLFAIAAPRVLCLAFLLAMITVHLHASSSEFLEVRIIAKYAIFSQGYTSKEKATSRAPQNNLRWHGFSEQAGCIFSLGKGRGGGNQIRLEVMPRLYI